MTARDRPHAFAIPTCPPVAASPRLPTFPMASDVTAGLNLLHHVLRDGWVYHDIDFELFDDDINDNGFD